MRLESAVRDIVSRPGSSVPGPPCAANGLVPGLKGSDDFTETASNCAFTASGEIARQGEGICAKRGAETTRIRAKIFKFPSRAAVVAPPSIRRTECFIILFQYLP